MVRNSRQVSHATGQHHASSATAHRFPIWLTLSPIFAAIAVLGALAFAMTERAAGRNVLTFDVTVGRWVQTADIPFGSLIATIGNGAGYTPVSVSVTVAAIGFAVLTRRWIDLIFLVTLFAARGVNAPLKSFADSPRPTGAFLSVSEFAKGHGFPSGHTMSAVLVAGGVAYMIAVALPSRRWRLVPVSVATFLILATAYGRVHAGAHWPTDVIGALLWGLILLLLAISVHHVLTCRSALRSHRP